MSDTDAVLLTPAGWQSLIATRDLRIAELEARYNEVKTQRDQLQQMTLAYKAVAEGWEDLYRRARQ